VDFIIAEKNKITPIEVKSSGYRSHSSIDAFCEKYSARVGRKLLLYTKDFQKDGNMELWPIVMTQFL
jgi:hypothetical protein